MILFQCPGHALIIPKRQVLSLLDLNKDEWDELHETIKQVISHIKKTDFKKLYEQDILDNEKSKSFCKNMLTKNLNLIPEDFDIVNNDGVSAGRTIHHLHIQIIPRYPGDVKNATGGIRNVIPDLGNYR